MTDFRIGIDLGGTKAEIIALADDGAELLRRRIPAPKIYHDVITALADLVRSVEHELGGTATVGVGIPGCISPATGLVKGASSTGLIGHPFDRDLGALLARDIRVENDANCFALSEATDGAGAGRAVVFGVILGTGCGGGLVVNGTILRGRHAIAGEWGHNPMPWPTPDEYPGRPCWCGLTGCLETVLSGTGLAVECDGPGARDASTLPIRAAAGDERARRALATHSERLARALAQTVNLLDPDVIVLGGGLSNLDLLYVDVPRLLPLHVFSDVCDTPILRNVHGDSSGVRGAAWLWPRKTEVLF
jgi:fructokinase